MTHRFHCQVLFLSLIISISEPCLSEQPVDANSITSSLASKSLLLDVTKTSERLITIGDRGHILISQKESGEWYQVQSPTQATLTSVFFINDSIGWATGHDAIILKTNDAGENWKIVYSAPAEELPLLDIWFSDELHGIAIGAYGYFLETNDGGEHWQQRHIGEDDFHLNQIQSAGDECLYIAAEAGYAYYSNNSGKDWELIETPYQGSFYSVLPVDCDHIWLAGLRGHLYYSSDAGNSWQRHTIPTNAMLTDMITTKDGNLVISALDGTILKQHKNGFNKYSSTYRDDFVAIIQSGKDMFTVVGNRGISVIGEKAFEKP